MSTIAVPAALPALTSGLRVAAAEMSTIKNIVLIFIKNIVLILCLCLLCTKVIVHTYRHFHPPPAAIIGP